VAKGLTPESVHLYADRQALDLEVVSTTSLRMTACGLLASPGDDDDHTCSRMNVRICCVVDCVEEDKFHDVLRIVLSLKDVHRGNAMLLSRGRAAGEVLQPRVEVGDPVFDVQDGHGPVLHMAAVLPFALSCQRGFAVPS